MSFGERAALEGLLAQLRPALSIEIGTAEGGSLARLAAYSKRVHSFDLVEPLDRAKALPNVQFHTGDSHVLLPQLLSKLAQSRFNVDFVLVDGDHSEEGVFQDVHDLLWSDALIRTVIVPHDTTNGTVRAGLERVPYGQFPKVVYVDLDFVPGYLSREGPFCGQLWGGLGLVVVDATGAWPRPEEVRQQRFHPAWELLQIASDAIQDEERATGGA
jgi:methyltransferase family protein